VLTAPFLFHRYTQFLFNAGILGAFLYLFYCVAATIIQDVRDKVNESSFGKCAIMCFTDAKHLIVFL
jgi:hypothetical protein